MRNYTSSGNTLTVAGWFFLRSTARESTDFSLYDASWIQLKRWSSLGLVVFTSMFAASWIEHSVYHTTRKANITYFSSPFLLLVFFMGNWIPIYILTFQAVTCLRIVEKFVKSLFGPHFICVFRMGLTVLCEICNTIEKLTEFPLDRQSIFCELRLSI